MSAELVFMMGNFEATFPTDRLYAKNHMWAQAIGEKRYRLGLAAYAVRLLQDVYFLDLTIEAPMPLKARQEIGSIESKKAESSLYTPTAGTVVAVNQALLDDPTGINLDNTALVGYSKLNPQAVNFSSRHNILSISPALGKSLSEPLKGKSMREARLTVVISQGQSRSPDKRQLETDVGAGAAALPGVDVLIVPHLYDLARDGETYTRLRATEGPIVLCAWLFDRAAHWVLDRNGVRGQVGLSLLKNANESEEDEEEAAAAEASAAEETERVTDLYPRPERRIYCIDFREKTDSASFVNEIARIAELEVASRFVTGAAAEHPNFQVPRNDTYVGHMQVAPAGNGGPALVTIDEHPSRRWYPVIDFSRCTNCMECIDFCLFGVYGVDNAETILVEQPDNCRKGCPACSRVCPQNAIIFPAAQDAGYRWCADG